MLFSRRFSLKKKKVEQGDDVKVDKNVYEDSLVQSIGEDDPSEDRYKSMTKLELDNHALREYGIHLDRRKNKETMIEDLLKKLQGSKKK